jgi:dipicolinate synthase subunit A
MCRQLSAMGKVYTYGIFCPDSENITALGNLWEMTEKADVLVLPIVSGDSEDIRCGDGSFVPCDEIAKHLSKHAVVVGGRLNTSQIELFSALGHDVVDYFKREEFVVKNCIPTAEGALQIALKEMGTTVFGSEVLITGYGRVAKACGRLFNAVGGNVTVAARSLSQLAEAENNGLGAFPLTELYGHIPRFDIIINTVPAMILTGRLSVLWQRILSLSILPLSPEVLILLPQPSLTNARYTLFRSPVRLHRLRQAESLRTRSEIF